MRHIMVWILAALLSACVAEGAERKGEARPGALSLETERVVVFKDGYALLVKRAEAVADSRGVTFMDEVPDSAVLGTFWAWSDRGPTLRSLRAEWREQEVEQEVRGTCTDPASILEANPGKRVTVELEGATMTGTVVAIPRHAGLVPTETLSSRSASFDPTLFGAAPSLGQMVALSVPERGTVVLAGKDIRRVSGQELSLECKRKVRITERRKRLSLDFGSEAAGKALSVRIVYFTPGLRWIPTYRFEAQKGGQGALALQAELLNELEDIQGAPFDLVVGVPNFRFRDVASPLSLEGMVRNALAQASPSLMGSMNSLSNAMFSQSPGEWQGGRNGAEESSAPRIPDFGGPAESPDFFIHPLAKMDLPKGARAVVPLWSEDVKTRDLYTLDVRVGRNENDSDTVQYGNSKSSMGSPSPLRLARAEVWHQLELKNATQYPWTTGPVLVMRGQVPQAQELLTYTGRGGDTLVPLTVATDVRALHEEVELERKQDALKSNRSSYALIRKKGTITLTNPRAERTPLRIRLSTGGKAQEVSGGGQVKVDDFRPEDWGGSGLAAVNSHSEIEWTLTLEPGERKTLTYEVGFWR
ncbi:DUF4139 domain-containing protein [Hyalangium versicolor]|uniref:DUF4139 domain-containing protein n=1 Tax=Hyalangium versicolor TaxID=2861190 RepID=UPI001CCD99F2|nr:DUF4139 domain-containing protein [Hyalangium versicolor]